MRLDRARISGYSEPKSRNYELSYGHLSGGPLFLVLRNYYRLSPPKSEANCEFCCFLLRRSASLFSLAASSRRSFFLSFFFIAVSRLLGDSLFS
jgi:hypothetical protein